MKNKIVLLAAVLSLGFAANVFAASASSASGSASGWVTATSGSINFGLKSGTPATPLLTLKPSANVVLYYTVYGTNTAYVAGSYHTSGSFAYGTSSVDTNIFRTGYTAGTDPTVPAYVAATNSVDWAGWTAAK